MKLKYNKNDGKLLLSAMEKNVNTTKVIISDLQDGCSYLVNMLNNPSAGLSGKAYQAASTLFAQFVEPTLTKVEMAVQDIESDMKIFEQEITIFDRFRDTIFDENLLLEELDLKKRQRENVQDQLNFLNNLHLGSILIQYVMENLLYEGKGMESVINQYDKEIQEIESKLRALQEFSYQTKSLFEDSLIVFQKAMLGVKALSAGSFDTQGRFSVPSGTDMSWLTELTEQSLESGGRKPQDKIKILMKTYGLNKERAEAFLEYNEKFKVYAKKQRWNKARATYEYMSLIASIRYGNDIKWRIFAGLMPFSELNKSLKKLGIEDVEGFKNTLDKKSEKAESNDLIHIFGSLALMNNPEKRLSNLATDSYFFPLIPFILNQIPIPFILNQIPISSILNQNSGVVKEFLKERMQAHNEGDLSAFATFRGDIASGSFDEADVRADLDALILNYRIQNDNQPITEIISDYATYPVDYRLEVIKIFGSEKAFKNKVYQCITDPADLLLKFSYKNFFTEDDAKRFWELYEGIK